MKLSEHTEHIRQLIDQAFRNRLGRMGINEGQLSAINSVPQEYQSERKRMETIREVFIAETGTIADAYDKLVEELTFTLFNRLAALKVMEAHTLHPEIVTRRESHGGRSFAHLAWLEQNPNGRTEEAEGLLPFLEDQLQKLAGDIPLFSPQHPYHLLPTAIELQSIINAFNQVETDTQVETEIWKSDDVLGWLYESYNNYKKAEHKASGDKTEYNKVSIQSQVYTPRWVVQFLVDNSLGKLYLEMYPDSAIKNKYKIANHPATQVRERKPLHEIRMIDPSTGSGNYLLYGFDVYYDLYIDQIENYGADYNEADIPKLIIENNLHGVDLDDRAIQLAQLGLYIKAKRKKRTAKLEHFNIVSSDFFLPAYAEVKNIFEDGNVGERERKIIEDVWEDLQNAHKFGSLIRLEEKLNLKWFGVQKAEPKGVITMFGQENLDNFETFRTSFFTNLQTAVAQNTAKQGQTFLNTKTQDAITFLQLLTQKYDVAVANPPYTDSADFGSELKKFINLNYKQNFKFNSNLYAAFIKRCSELVNSDGYIGMLHPLTFMYISSFKEVRKYILSKTHIEILAELGLGGVFANSDVQADVVAYVLKNSKQDNKSIFLDFKKYKNHTNKPEIFSTVYDNLINKLGDKHIFTISENLLKEIEDWPFIYWISESFRKKFKDLTLGKVSDIRAGIQTSNNDRFLRHWWEIGISDIIDNVSVDNGVKRWSLYSKGGPYNKWSGNLWSIIDWKDKGAFLQKYLNSVGQDLHAQEYYFKEGITYSASGSKGISFRYLPSHCLFDIGGSSIFITKPLTTSKYLIGLLNSKLAFYIVNCLNPTVNVQPQDLKRIPFIEPDKKTEDIVVSLSTININIKDNLLKYRVIEKTFSQSPISNYQDNTLKERLLSFVDAENMELTKVLLNETILNKIIFQLYEFSEVDLEQVVNNVGKSVGDYPIQNQARHYFLLHNSELITEVNEHVNNLEEIEFENNFIKEIKENFNTLYQGNSNLEEFCIKYQVNPINIWYWFKEENYLPNSVASEYALEFLADTFRTLLMEDEDGIIPLVGLPGEVAFSQRIEQYCLQNGFTSAQYLQLDGLLGKPLNQYIEHHFFIAFVDHVKLFKQMPSTPFIWHLSSGRHQGFEAYIIIYKWNRDSLFKLKSQYISQRVQNLEYRQITLQDVNTAQAQTEKETIRLQLQEIEIFKTKIDELIAENYDPKLDDGVGKNIAPLQKKGLLRAEVLKTTGGAKSQLEKYLNADW